MWWLYWTLISWQERFRFLDWIYVRSSILKIFLKRPNINPGEDSLKGDKVDLRAIWLMARANKFYISHHSARAPLVRRLNTLFIFSQQNFFVYILIKKSAKLNLKPEAFEAGLNTPRGQEKMCFWRSLVQTFAIVSKSVETLRHVILWLSLLRGFSSRFRLLEFYSYIENWRLLLIRSFLPSKIVLRVT